MRLKGFRVENYKGIRSASAEDLSGEPVILVSGKNGTGKSLILEAISMAYASRFYDVSSRVGPYASTCSITLEFALSDAELTALHDWNIEQNLTTPGNSPVIIDYLFSKNGNVSVGPRHNLAFDSLRNEAFQREHPFARVDLLPSTRLLPGYSGMAVDPGLLDPKRAAQERLSALDQYLQSRQPATLDNVFTYLATTDYVDLMSIRYGGTPSEEFAKLTGPFADATGKRINPPESTPDFAIRMTVTLPDSNIDHPVTELSAGEQELLMLSYFVRRANASGGILLIDEPEQHLHPTLQAAALAQIISMSPNSQVIAVTHSVNILTSAPPTAVLSMAGATTSTESPQLTKVSDDEGKLRLIGELGITAADLVQSDFIVIVEGPSDESLLRALFPQYTNKALFVTAGGVDGVMKTCDSFMKVPPIIPYICFRDRDFLTNEERETLMSQYCNLHIWSRRMIENELLDDILISAIFSRAGSPQDLEAVRSTIDQLFTHDVKAEVIEFMLDQRLGSIKPGNPMPDVPKGVERQRASYHQLLEAATARIERFDATLAEVQSEIDVRWNSEKRLLANGKRILAGLTKPSPVKDVKAAAVAAFLADEACRPEGLKNASDKLAALADRRGGQHDRSPSQIRSANLTS